LRKVNIDMIGELALVFSIGILGIWKSIPVGLLMGMAPLWISLMTIFGATAGIIIIYFIGNNIKKYLRKMMKESSIEKKENRLINLFNKYGVHGLGIIGTFFLGPNMTMALGIAFVNKPRTLFIWTFIGIVVWTFTLTYLGHFGISIF